MPERIQLRRTKGWRKPEGAIVVSRPAKWGNPWTVERQPECPWSVHTWTDFALEALPEGPWAFWRKGTESACRARAVAEYRAALTGGKLRVDVTTVRAELAGRDLACWCPLSQPCHADVLLEVANA
jgi:hypothetical protein